MLVAVCARPVRFYLHLRVVLGQLLVFCNWRSDRVKILYWDGDGWVIWYERMEGGTYEFPFAETGRKEIAAWELGVLLEGIDLTKGRRRKRLQPAGGSGTDFQSVQEFFSTLLVSCPGKTLHMFVCLWDRLLTRAALYFQRAPEPRA